MLRCVCRSAAESHETDLTSALAAHTATTAAIKTMFFEKAALAASRLSSCIDFTMLLRRFLAKDTMSLNDTQYTRIRIAPSRLPRIPQLQGWQCSVYEESFPCSICQVRHA